LLLVEDEKLMDYLYSRVLLLPLNSFNLQK
jgi:hypothetical protein